MAEGSEHWATSGNALIGATMRVDFHYADSANITFVISSSGPKKTHKISNSPRLNVNRVVRETSFEL